MELYNIIRGKKNSLSHTLLQTYQIETLQIEFFIFSHYDTELIKFDDIFTVTEKLIDNWRLGYVGKKSSSL